ncbi:MAG: hypothetical protein AAGG53_18230 [Cyanobacteria bacterium P01_H01_bin.152]
MPKANGRRHRGLVSEPGAIACRSFGISEIKMVDATELEAARR